MKRIVIGDCREELLSTLEIILKNWGYRTLTTSDNNQFLSLLKELKPELIITGSTFCSKKEIIQGINDCGSPTILIGNPNKKNTEIKELERLSYPVDVFRLFEATQKRLEKIPRRNIRLNVQLPSMYYFGDAPCIAEVISLSSEGLFIKTGSRIEGLDEMRIILPLLGLQAEIELQGRIVYRVDPTPDNNYLQGMGIEFVDVSQENTDLLHQFVENLLITELSDKKYIQDALDMQQLQSRTTNLTLKISPLS